MPTQMSRRTILATGVALAAGAPLAACTTSKPPAAPATPSNPAILPTYKRFEGVAPDLAGTGTGVPDAFLQYPSSPTAVVTAKPATAPISLLCANDGVMAPAMDRNSFWQGLNERLGAALTIDSVIGADYNNKVNTVLAGNDLPDLVQLNLQLPRLGELVTRRFTDLTPYLAGDAVNDYPMLANLPTIAWQNVAISGGLYGVPYPSVLPDSLLYVRSDLAKKLGVAIEPKSADEFTELCAALTNERERRWALGGGMNILKWVTAMFGAPNQWRIESDGRFVRAWETPEFRQAVEYTAGLHAKKFFHPNSFLPSPGTTGFFNSGELMITSAGVMWWPNFYRDASSVPGFEVAPIRTPKHDGTGPAKTYLLSGLYTFAGISAGLAPDRVREILRVQDYLAAPFGSAEHLYRTYGEEGVHHTRVNGNPVLTDKGKAEVTPLPVRFASGSPTVIFTPGMAEATRLNHQLQQELIADGVPLPTVGLVSPTQTSKGAALDRAVNDVVSDIVQGRRSITDLDTEARRWRTNGGDQIAEELQAAKAQR